MKDLKNNPLGHIYADISNVQRNLPLDCSSYSAGDVPSLQKGVIWGGNVIVPVQCSMNFLACFLSVTEVNGGAVWPSEHRLLKWFMEHHKIWQPLLFQRESKIIPIEHLQGKFGSLLHERGAEMTTCSQLSLISFCYLGLTKTKTSLKAEIRKGDVCICLSSCIPLLLDYSCFLWNEAWSRDYNNKYHKGHTAFNILPGMSPPPPSPMSYAQAGS